MEFLPLTQCSDSHYLLCLKRWVDTTAGATSAVSTATSNITDLNVKLVRSPTTQVNVLILFLAVYEAVGWFYLDAEAFMKSISK